MRLIKLNEDKIVIQVRNNAKEIYEGEIETSQGYLGQVMNSDGSFSDVVYEVNDEETSLKEKLLAENQYQTVLIETLLMGGI